MKRCTSCATVLPLAAYPSNGPGRLRSACRACESYRDKGRRQSTPKPLPMTVEERKERERERGRARRAALAALRPPPLPKKPPRVKVSRYGPEPGVLVLDGVARTRDEWAKRLGLAGPSSLTNRTESLHWPMERTLSQHVVFQNLKSIQRQPLPSKHDVLFYDGRTQSIVAWAAELAGPLRMTVPALCLRLRNGWPVERALSTIVRPYRCRKPKEQTLEFCGPKGPETFKSTARPGGAPGPRFFPGHARPVLRRPLKCHAPRAPPPSPASPGSHWGGGPLSLGPAHTVPANLPACLKRPGRPWPA
jgi:hypothetical protein